MPGTTIAARGIGICLKLQTEKQATFSKQDLLGAEGVAVEDSVVQWNNGPRLQFRLPVQRTLSKASLQYQPDPEGEDLHDGLQLSEHGVPLFQLARLEDGLSEGSLL